MSRPARERLEAVLEAEERLYREMRELLQKERALIVALDAPGLTEVALEKEALASEGRMLERSRLEVTEELARELGLPTPRPTLSELCAALGAGAGRLPEIHSRLVALVGATRELLDANASFAGDVLAQVGSTLRHLGRLLQERPLYQPGRLAEGPAATGRLLRRTA